MELVVLTGYVLDKAKNGSYPCQPGLLDIVKPKYRVNQKVMLLEFQWGFLVHKREVVIDQVKKNVVHIPEVGLFYNGYQCWSNQYDDSNYNGSVNYYRERNGYYLIPIKEYNKLTKRKITDYSEFTQNISIFK